MMIRCDSCEWLFAGDDDATTCDECLGVVHPDVWCSLCEEEHAGGCWGSTVRPIAG